MKAPFRRIERDDEQRNRKWRALALGLFVASAGMASALGPNVPSTPFHVSLTVAVTSALAGAIVGWKVRERKGSMGGMVSLLFAFPLGGLLVGFPQSAGLMWIILLFVGVPFGAMGGAFGSRLARRGTQWPAFVLAVLSFLLVVVAVNSKCTAISKVVEFSKGQQPFVVKLIADEFIDGAQKWKWNVRWEKGMWNGDYFVLSSSEKNWDATAVCTDSVDANLVRFSALRNVGTPLHSSNDEMEARKTLLTIGLRDGLLQNARLIQDVEDKFWIFSRTPAVHAYLFIGRGTAAVLFIPDQTPSTRVIADSTGL